MKYDMEKMIRGIKIKNKKEEKKCTIKKILPKKNLLVIVAVL